MGVFINLSLPLSKALPHSCVCCQRNNKGTGLSKWQQNQISLPSQTSVSDTLHTINQHLSCPRRFKGGTWVPFKDCFQQSCWHSQGQLPDLGVGRLECQTNGLCLMSIREVFFVCVWTWLSTSQIDGFRFSLEPDEVSFALWFEDVCL